MKENTIEHKNSQARKSVVPFNPALRWPEGYFEVLAEAGIPERERPFHVHWARPFFNRHPGRARRSLGIREMTRFLAALRDSPAMELTLPMKPLHTRLQEARKRLKIPWEVLERDYLLSWVLAGIAQVDIFRDTLIFKGRTVLKSGKFGSSILSIFSDKQGSHS